ncbi:ABC transporter ATP-binding protein [Nitrospira sp. BLG_1]|uniref:ABC transporter ATP-binding protein n=1 Tax=Nitrospira sp. BLG_1 TaxID=3395883 RepID=UPI0039BD7B49
MRQTEITRRGQARFRTIIASHLRSAWPHLALATGCLLGVTLMQLMAPWPLKLIFDYILLQKSLPPSLTFLDPFIQSWPLALLGSLAASIAVIAAMNGALSYAQSFVTSKIGHRLVFTIRQHLFAHVQRLSLSFHSQTRSGELLTKLAGDTQTLKNAFTDIPLAVSGHILTFIGMFVVMFALNWELSLIILATMPILVTALFILNRNILATTRDQRERDSHMTSRLNEWLSSISVVQTFGRERVEQDRFNQESTKHLHTGLRTARTTAAVARVVSIIGAISTAVTVFLGAWQVLKARITPGDLLVFVSYMKNIYGPIKDMSKLSSQFSQAMVSAQRIADLLGNEPDIQDRPDAVKVNHLIGDIRLEHISFSYLEGCPVLRDLTLQIAPGQRVAFVGPSGAGKSTLVSLLLRLYQPSQGTILLDDRSLADYERESLRHSIGVVLQDTLLFQASIADNIAYGVEQATREQIVKAAQEANAHEFIAELPDGYDTIVGERGGTLSGGQRQRICLARALVKQPSILMLDEPTASLDHRSATYVRETITRIQADRTTIVITHHLVGMDLFDRIFVLDQGRLVEQGTHRELLSQHGLYAGLYVQQSDHLVHPRSNNLT